MKITLRRSIGNNELRLLLCGETIRQDDITNKKEFEYDYVDKRIRPISTYVDDIWLLGQFNQFFVVLSVDSRRVTLKEKIITQPKPFEYLRFWNGKDTTDGVKFRVIEGYIESYSITDVDKIYVSESKCKRYKEYSLIRDNYDIIEDRDKLLDTRESAEKLNDIRIAIGEYTQSQKNGVITFNKDSNLDKLLEQQNRYRYYIEEAYKEIREKRKKTRKTNETSVGTQINTNPNIDEQRKTSDTYEETWAGHMIRKEMAERAEKARQKARQQAEKEKQQADKEKQRIQKEKQRIEKKRQIRQEQERQREEQTRQARKERDTRLKEITRKETFEKRAKERQEQIELAIKTRREEEQKYRTEMYKSLMPEQPIETIEIDDDIMVTLSNLTEYFKNEKSYEFRRLFNMKNGYNCLISFHKKTRHVQIYMIADVKKDTNVITDKILVTTYLRKINGMKYSKEYSKNNTYTEYYEHSKKLVELVNNLEKSIKTLEYTDIMNFV